VFSAYLADVERAFFHSPGAENCVIEPTVELLEENPGDWV